MLKKCVDEEATQRGFNQFIGFFLTFALIESVWKIAVVIIDSVQFVQSEDQSLYQTPMVLRQAELGSNVLRLLLDIYACFAFSTFVFYYLSEAIQK